jgi:hypothetical protein
VGLNNCSLEQVLGFFVGFVQRMKRPSEKKGNNSVRNNKICQEKISEVIDIHTLGRSCKKKNVTLPF